MIKVLLYIVSLITHYFCIAPNHEISKYEPVDKELCHTIVKMNVTDTNAYANYQIETPAKLFFEEIAFFYSKGEAPKTEEKAVISLQEGICDIRTSIFIKENIEAYPIPKYGVFQIDHHRFF